MAKNPARAKLKMLYPDYIELPFVKEREAPAFEDNSDQYPESLVRYFLKAFTKKKDGEDVGL